MYLDCNTAHLLLLKNVYFFQIIYCETSYSRHILIPAFFEFVEIKVLPWIWCVDFKVVVYIKLYENGTFFLVGSWKCREYGDAVNFEDHGFRGSEFDVLQ